MLNLLFLILICNSAFGVYVAHPEKHCNASDMKKMVEIFKADTRPACRNGHVGKAKIKPEICDCFSDDGPKVKQALGSIPDCHIGFAGEDILLADLFDNKKCKTHIVVNQRPQGAVPKELTTLNPWASEREQVMVASGVEYPADLQANLKEFQDVAVGKELQSLWDIVSSLTCDCLGCVWFWGSQGMRPCNCIDGLASAVKNMIQFVTGILAQAVDWVFNNISFLRAVKDKINNFVEEKFGKPIEQCQKETGFSLNAVTKRFNEMCTSGKIDFGKVFAGADKFFGCMKRKAFGTAELARLEEQMKAMLVWNERFAVQQEEGVEAQRRLSQKDQCGTNQSHCQSNKYQFFQDPTLVFTLGFTMSGSKATINVKFGLQTGRLAVTFGLVSGLSGKTHTNAYTLIMEKLGRELPVFSGFEVQFFRKFHFNKEGIPIPMINIPLGDMLPAPVGPFIKVIIKGGIVRLSLLRVKSCEDNSINLGGGCQLTFGGIAITPNIPFLSGATPAAPPPSLIMPIWGTTIIEFYTGLITKNGKQCGYGIGGALCGGAKTTPYASLTAFTTEQEADMGMLKDLQTYKMQVNTARTVEDFFISQMEQEEEEEAQSQGVQIDYIQYGAAGAVLLTIGGIMIKRMRDRSDSYQLLLEA